MSLNSGLPSHRQVRTGILSPGVSEAIRVQTRRAIGEHAAFAKYAALKPLLEAVEKLREEEARPYAAGSSWNGPRILPPPLPNAQGLDVLRRWLW